MSYTPKPLAVPASRQKVSLFLPNINQKLDTMAADTRMISRSQMAHYGSNAEGRGMVIGSYSKNLKGPRKSEHIVGTYPTTAKNIQP